MLLLIFVSLPFLFNLAAANPSSKPKHILAEKVCRCYIKIIAAPRIIHNYCVYVRSILVCLFVYLSVSLCLSANGSIPHNRLYLIFLQILCKFSDFVGWISFFLICCVQTVHR